jgi:hypothetical protein
LNKRKEKRKQTSEVTSTADLFVGFPRIKLNPLFSA